MSSYVYAVWQPDETFHKMKAVWDACEAAGIQPPSAVADYFGDEDPDPAGVVLDITRTESVTPWGEDMREGFEVDVTKLPAGTKFLRFVNSY